MVHMCSQLPLIGDDGTYTGHRKVYEKCEEMPLERLESRNKINMDIENIE